MNHSCGAAKEGRTPLELILQVTLPPCLDQYTGR